MDGGRTSPGEYHLEQLDLMLQLAEETGLKVMVQTYLDSAPDWLAVNFPDGQLVAQNCQFASRAPQPRSNPEIAGTRSM